MKAIISTKHGPAEGLELKELPKPAPRANEVLIKVHAATVTTGDVLLRKMHPLMFIPAQLFGMKRKKTPGHEFAGEIETVGENVNRFKAGDRVVGTTTGLGVGANAEYICLAESGKTNKLEKLPDGVSYEQGAALPVGGMTALYLLQKCDIRSGQKALIYGASGSVGTYAVQLAKHLGANVTGVCSTGNIELVKSLGADHVIDYTREDVAESGEKYDLVFDAVGKLPAQSSKSLLAPGGNAVSIRTMTNPGPEHLQLLIELLAKGELKAVIDKRYPLEQTAAAHRYVESGHKKGNVVIHVIPAK